MKYLSIDLETTGLDAKKCQILEIAAILADTCDSETDPVHLPTFHRRIFHDLIVGEPYALWMNAELIKQMPKYPTPDCLLQDDMWWDLVKWLGSIGLKREDKIVCTGKNFGMFDADFLDKIKPWDWSWFRHRILDPGQMYLDPLKDEKPPDTKECIKRAGLEWDEKKLHSAVDDARLVIHLLRRGFNVNR